MTTMPKKRFTRSGPDASAAATASSFHPSMVMICKTIMMERPKLSKLRKSSIGLCADLQHTSPSASSHVTPPRPKGSQMAPSMATVDRRGHDRYGSTTPAEGTDMDAAAAADTLPVPVRSVGGDDGNNSPSAHLPVSFPPNSMVPDTAATSRNQPRKISASRRSGADAMVVRMRSWPSLKFFMARSGRKHRNERSARNWLPRSVRKRDASEPSNKRKSNWFHPLAK
mmetsp:Transcript_37974/g.94385  ORF Transcript_37974/g.94385 Transcript_37974/m.94385 type:complete len:226 (-) Transcript_37974:622-1299(-)